MTAPERVLVAAELRASIENEQREIDALPRQKWSRTVKAIVAMLALMTAALGLWAYWMLWPYQTVSKTPQPMHIVAGYETVRQGESVVYEYDFEKFTDVEPTIHRQFVDGLIFNSASESTHLIRGSGHVHVAVPIPYTLPPGRYKIRVYADFKVNPVRTVEVIDETQTFEVLPATVHPDAPQDSEQSSATIGP